MNRFSHLVMLVLLASLLAACGSKEAAQAPPVETPAEQGSREATEVATAAFAPVLLEGPILGFYEPSFSYSVRSISKPDPGTQGTEGVTLEFWATSIEDAHKDIERAMLASGYRVSESKAENGYFSSKYEQDERPAVLVNVSPKGNRKMLAPDAKGTIYFQW